MNFYKKWVICKKIIQEEVSIYETCERDIGAPDIHKFPRVDGLLTGPPGWGVTKSPSKKLTIKLMTIALIIMVHYL